MIRAGVALGLAVAASVVLLVVLAARGDVYGESASARAAISDGDSSSRVTAAAPTNFKQEQRLNSLALQYAADAFAPKNRFGLAISGAAARTQFQDSLNSDIASGDTSLLLRMLGLNDLTGTNEPSLVVGAANGRPILPPGNPATYTGASDLDWWYSQNASEIDANNIPTAQLSGSIVSKAFAVGPGSMSFDVRLIGPLALSNARIAATVGGVSTPLTSSNGFPPGHLPSELIDPGLQSFESMSAGRLAGNIRAASLAAAPVPSALLSGGLSGCNEGYLASNTWLDLLIGGCTVTMFGIRQITPSQPDESDLAAPVAGAGAPYILTRTGNAVTGCRDKNAATVLLSTCLNAAAYSAYFHFTSDRVIVPGPANATMTPTPTDTATPTLTATPTITPTFTATATNTPVPDSDGDGVADAVDNCPLVANADQKNTDGDFVDLHVYGKSYDDKTVANSDDLGDACDADMDNDGFANADELQLGPAVGALGGTGSSHGLCASATAATDPLKLDTDGDLTADRAECALGTDPVDPLSKPPGAYATGDTDHDGLPDAVETVLGTDPNVADTDGDGLSDGVEVRGYGSDPLSANSDGDVCPDGKEVGSINGDTAVNSTDLLQIALAFSASSSALNYIPDFDLNRNGAINSSDLLIAAKQFGVCT